MSATATIVWTRPWPTDGIAAVAEGSDVPVMRPRTGARASNRQLATLLREALVDLSDCSCSFWACKGPKRPRHMATCRKCWAMRKIATVLATLDAGSAMP